jgi:metal-sulfur cluster biosynthetic enzyme
MPATLSGVGVEAVLDALATVRDPELDEPVTELDFVQAVHVSDSAVRVELRLPTYFCAPNFAYLMVADAYDACAELPGVEQVTVSLVDHFAADEINAGVAARAGFVASFDGLAERELDDLRNEFLRKAMLAAQDRVVRPLLAAGVHLDELGTLHLGDVPESADRERLRARRAELGIPSEDADPLLVHLDGSRVASGDVHLHVRGARTVRVSIDANGEYCRQLLTERYGLAAG